MTPDARPPTAVTQEGGDDNDDTNEVRVLISLNQFANARCQEKQEGLIRLNVENDDVENATSLVGESLALRGHRNGIDENVENLK